MFWWPTDVWMLSRHNSPRQIILDFLSILFQTLLTEKPPKLHLALINHIRWIWNLKDWLDFSLGSVLFWYFSSAKKTLNKLTPLGQTERALKRLFLLTRSADITANVVVVGFIWWPFQAAAFYMLVSAERAVHEQTEKHHPQGHSHPSTSSWKDVAAEVSQELNL